MIFGVLFTRVSLMHFGTWSSCIPLFTKMNHKIMFQQTYKNLTIQKRGLHEFKWFHSYNCIIRFSCFSKHYYIYIYLKSYFCIVTGEILIFIGRLSQGNAISIYSFCNTVLKIFNAKFLKWHFHSRLTLTW